MEGSLGILPADVHKVIWSHLELVDVVRFGSTTKKMLKLTWPYHKNVTVADREYSAIEDVISFVLSQDLSHIQSLYLHFMPNRVKRVPAEKVAAKVSLIDPKTLPNLLDFTIDIQLPKELLKNYDIAGNIKNTLRDLTQLQSLHWHSAEIPEKNFNVGQFLSAHSRLTSFAIQTKYTFHGVHLLTQLKDLEISFCNSLPDSTLAEALTLTQLKSLALVFNNAKDHMNSFTNLVNLTNLERLEMTQMTEIKSAFMNQLFCLPKLSSLAIDFPWSIDKNDVDATVSIIGQLSKLTTLQLNGISCSVDLGTLTGLVDLQQLDIGTDIYGADFSSFSRLTVLHLRPTNEDAFEIRGKLPISLRHLNMNNFDITNEDIISVCGLTNLEVLRILDNNFDADVLADHVTNLKRLNYLTIFPHGTQNVISALQQLHNLGTLTFNEIPHELIGDLAKLTQLVEFKYCDNKFNPTIKSMVPFRVNFMGDPAKPETDSDGEYMDNDNEDDDEDGANKDDAEDVMHIEVDDEDARQRYLNVMDDD